MLRAIAASEWVAFEPQYLEVFKETYCIPVNDVYLPIWEKEASINLIHGGRGGGKSQVIAERLLKKCLSSKYFKCYYGRKVFETVRDSVFDTIVTSIEELALSHLFSYSRANTSSMVITCRLNGNKFIPFGCDKASKLKSIKDPTDIWCDEFDQFTFDDFKELYPSLRTIRGLNQFWGSFNTHSVYLDQHWIIKLFFSDIYTGEDKDKMYEIEVGSIQKIFANFTDNYFIDQEAYRSLLRIAAGGNEALFEGIANGEWGVVENDNPWLYAFDERKHVKQSIEIRPELPVYLSFDFNNSPFACTAYQHNPDMGDPRVSFIHAIKEFSGKIKADEMCEQIKAFFPNSVLYVTGDRNGNNQDIGRNQTIYELIQHHLGLSANQMKLNSHNLEHADSRIFVNCMLNDYPNFFISRKGCPNLVKQCNAARVDIKSKTPQALLKDREQNKNDEFDSFRYYMQTFFHAYAKKKFFKIIK